MAQGNGHYPGMQELNIPCTVTAQHLRLNALCIIIQQFLGANTNTQESHVGRYLTHKEKSIVTCVQPFPSEQDMVHMKTKYYKKCEIVYLCKFEVVTLV